MDIPGGRAYNEGSFTEPGNLLPTYVMFKLYISIGTVSFTLF